MSDPLVDPEAWARLDDPARRDRVREALAAGIGEHEAVREVLVSPGPPERPFDLSAGVRTDVGVLRTSLWSQARAELYADSSVHPANREKFAPGPAIDAAVERLAGRLEVRYELGRRGLEVRQPVGTNVTRTWTIEKQMLRGGARVVREDRVEEPGSADLRELLASLYTGPSLRAVDAGGEEPFFIPAATDDGAEGEWVALCRSCGRWEPGAARRCASCEAPVDLRLAVRPPGV